jgi:type IV secretion system protein VirD4
VQNIADILVDPTGKEVDRSHWKLTSFQLLVGVILHVLYAERDKSLHGVASFLSRPGVHVREQIKRMLYTPHLGSEPHPEIAGIAQEVLNKPKEEFGSLISTTLSYLSLYRDPIIATITRSSDFRLRDLMHGERPLSLYLSVPPSDSSRTRPLFRLMINQIIRALTEDKVKPGEKHYKHRLLLLLDEFPELGRLDALQDTIAFLGGLRPQSLLRFQHRCQSGIRGQRHENRQNVLRPERHEDGTAHPNQLRRRPHGVVAVA